MLGELIKEAVLLKNYFDGAMNQKAQFMTSSILGHRRLIAKAPSSTRDEVSADVKKAKGAIPE